MQRYGLTIVTQPTFEPVTVGDVVSRLRLDESAEENALISSLITTARQKIEAEYGLVCAETVFDQFLDCYPKDYTIRLQKWPILSVTSFKYLDSEGTLTTLASTQYDSKLNINPARIQPAYGIQWPTLRNVSEQIQIRFSAGYSSQSAIPETIKTAIILLIGHWYENREQTTIADLRNIPFGVDALLCRHQLMTAGYL